MNPQTIKIPKPLLSLATTHAGGNVIPKTTKSAAPLLIDWNRLTTHASYAAPPLVAISSMILVIIGASPQLTNIIQGEKVATTPSPIILMCSTLEACSTSHVDALGEEDEDASGFEEVVRAFLLFMFLLTLKSSHGKCRAPNLLSRDQFRSCTVLEELM